VTGTCQPSQTFSEAIQMASLTFLFGVKTWYQFQETKLHWLPFWDQQLRYVLSPLTWCATAWSCKFCYLKQQWILNMIRIVNPLHSCRSNCWYIVKKCVQIGHQQLVLQNLYSADRGVKYKNMSVLSTISVLPLSRLFVVGTEDGFIKICH
jgi:hypothetical protein